MSKKPMSWLELIKLKLSEEKSKGNSPSINDIMPAAKKEWAQIKAGTHPEYMQGKSQTFARKKKGDGNKKTRKASSSSSKKASSSNNKASEASSSLTDIQDILAQVKMCGKCKKKVEKILAKKNMKGGYDPFYNVPTIDSDGTLVAPAAGGNATEVTGYDKNVPTYSGLKGGIGKKGKSKKNKKGGCGGVCIGGSSA